MIPRKNNLLRFIAVFALLLTAGAPPAAAQLPAAPEAAASASPQTNQPPAAPPSAPVRSSVPSPLTTPLGTTTRVSVASDGTEGNSDSGYSSISADGRYVAFDSTAGNLVSGDTNSVYDVFVHDLQTEQTERVSVASDGTQGNNASAYPSISADGRYVAFWSIASNLVISDTNGVQDVFVHDRQTGRTERVSVASDGTQGNNVSHDYPSISADGRYVAFCSDANNLVISDTNSVRDVFVYDRQTAQTERVSVASDGTEGNNGSSSLSERPQSRRVETVIDWRHDPKIQNR